MEIFWRLVLGHMIADFTLQTNYIAAWKRRSFWGLSAHVATHGVVYAALLWNYLNQPWILIGSVQLNGIACLSCILMLHILQDGYRIWSVTKLNVADSTFFYLIDQAIHWAVLYIFSPSLHPGEVRLGFIQSLPLSGIIPMGYFPNLSGIDRFLTISQPERWVFFLILAVAVTTFATVTIYFIEKDIYKKEFPDNHEQYFLTIERVAVFACLLLPEMWWTTLFFIWTARYITHKRFLAFDVRWANVLAGHGLALFCGILARNFVLS